MDLFSTTVLARVVEALDEPASFLLDSFFPMVQTDPLGREEIYFDIDESKPRLTPFCSPLIAGRVVEDQGYSTKSFKPAYAKDKRRFLPNAPLRRRRGETIGGALTPMQRRQAQLAESLEDQLEMLTRREEVMAAEALTTGKVTVTGDGYPTMVVDFGRDPALTVSLADDDRWGETGVKPVDGIEDWAALIQEKSGAVVRDVIMDPKAWKIFRADPHVEKLLDMRRGGDPTLQVGPMARGQGQQKARYVGSIGDFDFWVYQDVYVDPADPTQATKLLMPDHSVIMASRGDAATGRGGLEGTRAYGVIQDEKANYQSPRYFTKSWLEEDPALRWLLMQSAPLVVPYRPNASLSATVR